MNLYEKLNEARAKFHELKLEKTGENKFAKYKYFELGDFLIPALKVFREVGLCANVSFPGNAVMTIRNVEKPEEIIVIESPMGSADLKGCHVVQNIGAVETYQRRYLWTAALEIVEHDALDATTGKDSGPVAASFRSSATMGALESLPVDEQTYIRDLAEEVKILPADKAYERIEGEKLEDTQKMGLWSLLDSKTRAAITKARQAKATA